MVHIVDNGHELNHAQLSGKQIVGSSRPISTCHFKPIMPDGLCCMPRVRTLTSCNGHVAKLETSAPSSHLSISRAVERRMNFVLQRTRLLYHVTARIARARRSAYNNIQQVTVGSLLLSHAKSVMTEVPIESVSCILTSLVCLHPRVPTRLIQLVGSHMDNVQSYWPVRPATNGSNAD